jgi:hypothetical protein
MAGSPPGLGSYLLFLINPIKYSAIISALQSTVHEEQYIVFICLPGRKHANCLNESMHGVSFWISSIYKQLKWYLQLPRESDLALH